MRGLEDESRRPRIQCWRMSSGSKSTSCRAKSKVCSMSTVMASVLVSRACSSSMMAVSARRAFARLSCPLFVASKADVWTVVKDKSRGSHFASMRSFISGGCIGGLERRTQMLLKAATISETRELFGVGEGEQIWASG